MRQYLQRPAAITAERAEADKQQGGGGLQSVTWHTKVPLTPWAAGGLPHEDGGIRRVDNNIYVRLNTTFLQDLDMFRLIIIIILQIVALNW